MILWLSQGLPSAMNSRFFLLFLTESENEEELDWNTHVALIIIAKQKMKSGMEIIEIEKNYFLGRTRRLGGIDMALGSESVSHKLFTDPKSVDVIGLK